MNEQQSKNAENEVTSVDPVVTPDPVIDSSHDTTAVGTGNKKVLVRNYAIATLIIVLMGGGLWLVLESQGRVQTNLLGSFASVGPAAVVNGVEISRADYETNRSQVEASASGQGADVTDPEVISQINTQAIETLVNTEILRQRAKELDITISEEDIAARRTAIVEQVGGEETLATNMGELGITEETLRSDIESELLIQALFAQEAGINDIEVTEEEIQQVFTQASEQEGVEELVLDDATREIIETNIRLSKEQPLVTTYIETLRAEAEVEINV